jgi:hypothetical protein
LPDEAIPDLGTHGDETRGCSNAELLKRAICEIASWLVQGVAAMEGHDEGMDAAQKEGRQCGVKPIVGVDEIERAACERAYTARKERCIRRSPAA